MIVQGRQRNEKKASLFKESQVEDESDESSGDDEGVGLIGRNPSYYKS